MKGFWSRFLRNRAAAAGLVFLSAVLLVSMAAPILFPGNPFGIVGKPFQPPFGQYLLGTDSLGRNVAMGIVHGARTSLMVGLIATLAAVLLGTLFGSFAGYYGGWLDDLLMRFTEFFQTIPYFIFAIVLVAILSPSKVTIIIAIATVSWAPIARLVRGEFLAARSREYVEAAVCAGLSDLAILFR